METGYTIYIKSYNFSGESVNITYIPNTDFKQINLGNQILPFEFAPFELNPPENGYGQYIIKNATGNCSYNFFVV